MSAPPDEPKIYHITHLDNLPSLIARGCLWSDAQTLRQGIHKTIIGMKDIKQRRLEKLEVECHLGTKVGDYVPFYFCPRSIMLCIMYYNNNPQLAYRGGQDPIVYLEADLPETIQWANQNGRRWAFSTINAGARYVDFYNRVQDLEKVDWEAVSAHDFSTPKVKEGKQAEFLLHESFPWHLFRRIGVKDVQKAAQVTKIIGTATHTPEVQVKSEWYF